MACWNAVTDPAVSVLLPYRDAAETLEESVASVLAQRGVDLEILAVDDGSGDGGPALVGGLAAADRRSVPMATGGAGLVAALALAASRARAPRLARMDADDIALPDRLRLQVDTLDGDPRLGAVGTRVEAFGDRGVGEGLARYVTWQNGLVTPGDHARDLFVESPLCHPSVLIRREALEAVGGYHDTPWWEDYDLWLRMDAAGWALAKVPEVLLRWRHADGRMTFAHPRSAPERTREAKGRYLAPRLAAAGRPVAVWGAGPTGRRLARALEPHGIRAHRFVDIDPRKIGRTARGVPIVEPGALRRGEETVVVAVGARGARALVRERLDRAGFVDGVDYVCAA